MECWNNGELEQWVFEEFGMRKGELGFEKSSFSINSEFGDCNKLSIYSHPVTVRN
jgi:hypothetical protein